MIVDTSVLVALLRDEPEAAAFARLMRTAGRRRLSAASYVELAAAVDGRGDAVVSGALDAWLAAWLIDVEPLTLAQARLARTAYQRFGRGPGIRRGSTSVTASPMRSHVIWTIPSCSRARTSRSRPSKW